MKHLITSIAFLFISFFVHAQYQVGIHAGVNLPYYHGNIKQSTGIEYTSADLIAGIYYKSAFSTAINLQIEALYVSGGIKNPRENNRAFKPTYISVPICLVLGKGPLTFEAGGYYARLISAKSWDFSGGNYHWKIKNLGYYNKTDLGLITGIAYNFIGVKLSARLQYGLTNVLVKGYIDPGLQGCKTTAISFTGYFPFNHWQR